MGAISIGTLHVIVVIVLVVIGVSRLVRLSRTFGERLPERVDADAEFEVASGIG
ncbi:hypothetical protein [Nitriliruptor alkaliphilus]|uniref:hypothetical protein n=1 Tax=Nitriliruptor alkaliphilus TaxID=427918 RepID=UPI0012EDCB5A|nr:hypothetical protein [Nitriliruptor alkaliphilus]